MDQLLAKLMIYADYVDVEAYRPKTGEVMPVRTSISAVGSVFSDLRFSSGCLPHGTVFWSMKAGQEVVGVYSPPTRQTLRFEAVTYYDVPMPSFLFGGYGKKVFLFALAEAVFPSAETVLYDPPLTNVYGDASICAGDNNWTVTGETVWTIWAEFWASRFTGHLVRYLEKKDVMKWWAELSGADAFPVEVLQPHQKIKTVGDLASGSLP